MSNTFDKALLNSILIEFQKGDKKHAYTKLKEYINTYTKDSLAIYNYAYISQHFNLTDIAIENYIKVTNLDKSNWQSRFNLYIIYIEQKKFKDALKLIDEVLSLKIDYQPALRDKALVLFYLNKQDVALNLILKSLKLNSQDYIAINTLGLIYKALKEFKKANECFLKAINIQPKYFPSYNNLGYCLQQLHDRDGALKNFIKAYKLNPNFAESINNIANIYSETGNYDKAIDYYKKALNLNSDIAQIYLNIAIAFFYKRDYSNAETYFKKSKEINPHDDKLNKNLSLFLLYKQNYKEAWKVADGRLSLQDFVFPNNYMHGIKKKLWRGEKIKKYSKVLVIKEQGVGDEILYSTIYKDLIKSFPNCKIETEARLVSLFKRSFKNDVIVPYLFYSKSKKELEKFDKVIFAGSLGRLFRNSIKDFPKKCSLEVDKDKLKKLNSIMNNYGRGLKIGIAWKSKRKLLGVDKSINLDQLKPIFELPNTVFFNLQYGETKNEIENFNKNHHIDIISLPEIDLYNDFESIGALLKNLDLFVSVSNSTVHLAGALNVPTMLIKPKDHVLLHYWNQPSNFTPWYPSIELYEYKKNWIATIADIKKQIMKNYFK